MDLNVQIQIILVVMFFVILVSIQYTLNKILLILKDIKVILLTKKEKQE